MKNHYQILKETIYFSIIRIIEGLHRFFSFYMEKGETESTELMTYPPKQETPDRSQKHFNFLNKVYVFIFYYQLQEQEEDDIICANSNKTTNELWTMLEEMKTSAANAETIAEGKFDEEQLDSRLDRLSQRQDSLQLKLADLDYRLTLLSSCLTTEKFSLRFNNELKILFEPVLSTERKKQIECNSEEDAIFNNNLHYR